MWRKQNLEWMMVNTVYSATKLTSTINIKTLFKHDYLRTTEVVAGLPKIFHSDRSSHRSSSAKKHHSKPKYVTICMIRSNLHKASFCLWLFAITLLHLESAGCNGSTLRSGWNSWLSINLIHIGLPKEVHNPHLKHILKWMKVCEWVFWQLL